MSTSPRSAQTQRTELLTQLRERYTSLTPAFQLAVRYILDHPEEVALSSMRQLAAHAGVQPATLVRFAQSLGYDGWQPLKAIFAADMRRGPQPYAQRARKLIRTGTGERLPAAMVESQQRNLEAWHAGSQEAFAQAVSMLTTPGQVHVAGFMSCFPIAFCMHYLYGLFRPGVSLVRGEAGTLEMELRAFKAKDVVFAVGYAPYSQEILRVVDAARERHCRIIALTDSNASPIALHADCVLLFSLESPSYFPSVAAGVAAVESLMAQVVARQGSGAVKALEQAEGQLRRTGAYAA